MGTGRPSRVRGPFFFFLSDNSKMPSRYQSSPMSDKFWFKAGRISCGEGCLYMFFAVSAVARQSVLLAVAPHPKNATALQGGHGPRQK